jgi:deoxyribose-phosphate aldolase
MDIEMVNTPDDRFHPEVMDFASRFHFASLGVEKTSLDLREAINKVLESGYIIEAFDCQMIYAPLAIDLFQERIKVHSPISYPMGNMTIKKKLRDLDYFKKIGIKDSCWCLNYREIIDHKFDRVEDEVRAAVKENDGIIPMAYVIQATILNNDEIINACKAVQNGGGARVKVATGYNWGTNPEHVALIRREFGYQLDIHPSGNIRTLAHVDEYIKLGVRIIHSMTCFDIIEEFIQRRRGKGGNGHE